MARGLEFKIASDIVEFEQIAKLNYETFVEEIPQHDANPVRVLEDKFHNENVYIICLDSGELVGMIAVRDKRPFSLDHKLENLDSYLPESSSLCEIRLLSVKTGRRHRKVIQGLFILLAEYCEEMNYDLALISATPSQSELYQKLGFIPFGSLVGKENAAYQPMYMTCESYLKFKEGNKLLSRMREPKPLDRIPLNLLPGPVSVKPSVKSAFVSSPVSHRSPVFIKDLKSVKAILSSLVNSKHVEILMGSGTLANDAVAYQLSLIRGKGLIISNGEFGERLCDHAVRTGLSFNSIKLKWGNSFTPGAIEKALQSDRKINWLWVVHAETSSGILNDLEILKKICTARDVLLCLDCVSSLGTTPLDLSDVYLASGVSGKGLASYAGLSFVFYNHEISPAPCFIPRYLDIGGYAKSEGVPYTLSSNLIYALKESIENTDFERRFGTLRELSLWLRGKLRHLGFLIIASEENFSPSLTTIVLPPQISSRELGERLEREGFFLSWRSVYLQKRNWIQISLMDECSKKNLLLLLKLLDDMLVSGIRRSL